MTHPRVSPAPNIRLTLINERGTKPARLREKRTAMMMLPRRDLRAMKSVLPRLYMTPVSRSPSMKKM